MAAKLPNVVVNQCRIQECGKPSGEIIRQTSAAGVEIVQVIFESHLLSMNVFWIVYCCYNAPAFFFGSEAFSQHIDACRHKPIWNIDIDMSRL